MFVLVALVFVAYAARVWKLGAQSLWLDEALSVVFARPSLRDVLTILVTRDLHPPLYYFTLHFWMKFAGQSEFSVRYVSILLGLPVVPATYVFGRSLFRSLDADPTTPPGFEASIAVGLLGGVFTALSPFLVYYAQEARMYSALVTFCVLSSLALWRYLQTGQRRWWVAYVGFTTATLYTQYFGGLVVGFQVLYLLGRFRERQRFVGGATALGAVGLLYLPWLPAAYDQMQRLLNVPDFWKGNFQLSYLIEHIFAAFAFGQFTTLRTAGPIAFVAAALVVAGLGFLVWRALRSGGAAVYLLGYLVVPFVALYVVLTRDPKFTERYLIMIAPPFYLVLSLAMVWLAVGGSKRRARVLRLGAPALSMILGLLLVAVSLTQLWQVYYGPGYRKDDNRAAVAYIKAHYQPGDVVVLMMDTYQSFVYYGGDSIPWTSLQPAGDTVYAANRLNEITAGHKRIWLYLWNAEWADPTGWVRQALETAFPQEAITRQFTGVELKLFDITPDYRFHPPTDPSVKLAVNFGNRMELLGYDLPKATLAAGESEKITFYWKALQPLSQDYIVSMRLTDGQFLWWQWDDRPARFNFATMYWKPNQVVAGELPFTVPPGTPPGSYSLDVSVYPQGHASSLNILDNGNVPAGTITTVATIQVTRPATPAAPTSIPLAHQHNDVFGGILKLFGVTVVNSRTEPGGSVDLLLGWQVLGSSLANYEWRVTATNGSYQRVVLSGPPEGGRLATSTWAANDVLLDRERLVIPPDAPPGALHFTLTVLSSAGMPLLASGQNEVDLGSTNVLDIKRLTTPPSNIQHRTDWRVGQFANLIGYSVEPTSVQPGGHVSLTLYWHARGNSGDVPYTVFSHLLDSHNLIAAQQDHPPGSGDTPTTGWIPNEYIVDKYDLTLKPDATPGTYRIEIGMYNPRTGTRLPVVNGNGQDPGDRIILDTVSVVK